MNISELKVILEANKVPGDLYSLDGRFLREGYRIDNNPDGFEVYYYERGGKRGVKVCNTEDEACEYLLNKLRRYFST